MVNDLSIAVKVSELTVANHPNKLGGAMQGEVEDASTIILKRDKQPTAG